MTSTGLTYWSLTQRLDKAKQIAVRILDQKLDLPMFHVAVPIPGVLAGSEQWATRGLQPGFQLASPSSGR